MSFEYSRAEINLIDLPTKKAFKYLPFTISDLMLFVCDYSSVCFTSATYMAATRRMSMSIIFFLFRRVISALTQTNHQKYLIFIHIQLYISPPLPHPISPVRRQMRI